MGDKLTTFDDYIRCKGIQPNAIYTPRMAAKILEVHPRTIREYMYTGRKTRRNGIISLHFHVNIKGCEIIGADLIEFLRQTHREGGA